MTMETLARPSAAAPTGTGGSSLTGTRRLLRLAARRDRVLLPVWVGALGLLLFASVASVVGLYSSAAEREQYALVAATNLVARAFDGPMAGTELGAIVMTETFGFLAVLVAIMSVQAVVRHTRLEEETGRAELVGSAVVGRHAPLTAALVLTFAANIAVGALTVTMFAAYDLPTGSSILAGLLLMSVGWTFAGIAAIAAQVSGSARGANGLAGAAVGVAFFLRAVGDALGEVTPSGVEVTSAWLSWLSPIGWGQQGRAFGGDRWWVLALFAALVVATVTIAFALTRHRDVGVGMRPVRAGPASASARLRSPLGLAWRLQRGSVIAWTSGVGIVALLFGAIGDEVDALLETSDELAELFAQLGDGDTLVDLYIVFMLGLVAVVVGAFAVQGVLRLRSEEMSGRAEPVLSTAVARERWMASHLTIVALGSTGMLLAVGLAGGTAFGLATGEWGTRFGEWVVAALVGVPAVWALAGFVIAAVGLVPRWGVAIGWSVLGVSLVMGQLGALFDLPQWVLNVSPFTHIPAVPAEQLRWLPILVLLAVAAGLTAVGLVAFRRRDLRT
jgi:ABC-2 type transport system permease protein